MSKALISFFFILASAAGAISQVPASFREDDIKRADPRPSRGFTYAYYLYVPPEIRNAKHGRHTILVLPNNTGKLDDDLGVHEADVKRRMLGAVGVASALKVAVIMPVFPRPATDWQIYTHALDRDSMLTTKREYRRLDLQLVAMIDDARSKLRKTGLAFDERVLLNGFSASGMFANRFVFLHPDRVKAAAIGSPGGWPIAPITSYKEKSLRYPIGLADFKAVAGREVDMKELRRVPMFIFLGDQDDNDSVPFDDSYDQEDRDLINPLLGKIPIDRWEISKQLYKEAGINAEFKLYPGVKHTVTPAMRDDIRAFFLKYAR
jgi:dienelactone hydrolase